MKALSIISTGQIKIIDVDKPTVGANEVLIKVTAAGLNKRDQFIREGKYPNIKFGSILGSDGVGVVEAQGSAVSKEWVGKKVIINPNLNWGNNEHVQARDYAILGMPSAGTFAEYIAVNVDRVHELTNHLTDEEAAALPLGGLTAFRACFHQGKMKKGENVLISGFGGGVAQFAFQFAKAAGANVFVTSSSQQKIDKALAMGASGGFNYKEAEWYKNPWQTKGGFDVVIDSAGGDQINTFIKMMRPGGRIVFYGATNGLPTSLDLYRMFWNQLTLQGTTMGNDQEFGAMLEFVRQHKITPIIESVKPFSEIIAAFDEMAGNSKIGKLVVKF